MSRSWKVKPSSGNFDLAAVVFGHMLNATATGGNFLIDILPSL